MNDLASLRLFATLLLTGCSLSWPPSGAEPPALAKTVDTGGPRVVFDMEARPLPEIPLPNDAATRLDPSSPTGRRINVSEIATTKLETETRKAFNQLDGWGTYSAITVSFERPLDLEDLVRRHRDNVDFRDDAVFLLNVDEDCDRFGEEVALDFGHGRFPVTLYKRGKLTPDPEAPTGYRRGNSGLYYFDRFDARATTNNLLYEEVWEDLDGDGVLDPDEDTDDDGVLDVPNFVDPTACLAYAPHRADGTVNPAFDSVAYDRCVADNLMTWYERETNTLVLRPVWPLEQTCTYAVVLSDRLTDDDGRAIVSPFAFVHHRDQRRDLEAVSALLPRYGLDVSNVAFAWTFTTGSMTKDLEALRAGLYGSGPFARLASEFDVDTLHLWDRAELAEADGVGETSMPGACVANGLTRFWRVRGEWAPNRCALEADFAGMGTIFGGTFDAPNLLVDGDGLASKRYPDDQDERWRIDSSAGTATYGRTAVTFWCALPIERAECEPGNPKGLPFCRPFPTILYAHGYGGARSEIGVGHIGRTTSMGYAMCGLDAYGHGLERMLDSENNLEAAVFRSRLQDELADLGLQGFDRMLLQGRDRDLDGDGYPDPGADMWTSDVFHTRDMVRQTALEYIQFVRILRSADGTRKDGRGSVLGDVDGDGVVDIGGADNTIGMWGISLGGIIAGVLSGAEPSLDSVSPNAGGAGLTDIAVRSSQAGVPQAVVMPLVGPFVEGCVAVDGHDRPVPPGEMGRGCFSDRLEGGVLEYGVNIAALNRTTRIRLGSVDGVTVGDVVRLDNLVNGESREVRVAPHGVFRVAVAADAAGPVQRRRAIFEMADADPDEMRSTEEVADRLGDRLRITVRGADGETKATIDTFETEVRLFNTVYPEGSPLVSLQEGLGLRRNSPRFRRFVGFAQIALGAADPAVWATRTFMEPANLDYDDNAWPAKTRVLHMPTAGDKQVPTNTGIAMARAAGVLGSWKRDPERFGPEVGWRELFAPRPEWGRSPDEVLLDRYVVEGDPRFERFPDNAVHANVLYDVDDISDGAARYTCGDSDWSGKNGENGCPDELRGQEVLFSVPRPEAEPPLRWNRPRDDGTFDAIRVPLLRPAGQHGIYNAQPFREFDSDAFMVNFTTRYLGTRGRAVDHTPGCDCSATLIPEHLVDGQVEYPALERQCEATDLNLCDETCGSAWGIRTEPRPQCISSGGGTR